MITLYRYRTFTLVVKSKEYFQNKMWEKKNNFQCEDIKWEKCACQIIQIFCVCTKHNIGTLLNVIIQKNVGQEVKLNETWVGLCNSNCV